MTHLCLDRLQLYPPNSDNILDFRSILVLGADADPAAIGTKWGQSVGTIARDWFWSFGRAWRRDAGIQMSRQLAVVLYVVAMVAVIVGVDFVFLRNRFWERLTVNIGIVLVFAAFYLTFLRRP